MQVLTIEYTQRVNLGNYEHEEVKLSARLEEGENPVTSIKSLKDIALKGLGFNQKSEEIKEEAIPQPQILEIQDDNKDKKASGKKSSKKSDKKGSEESSSEVVQENKVIKKKSDAVAYDRESIQHKAIFTTYLNSSFPGWASKAGVKDFSMSLVGKDFVDSKGEIVESFKALVTGFFA